MLKKTLLSFRTDKKFEELKMKTDEKSAEYGLKTPERRQLATPAAIQHNNRISTEERRSSGQQWKIELFEALDYVQGQITRRFDQEDLVVAVARENLLSSADLTDGDLATSKLPNNIDCDKLRRQLLQLHDLCTSRGGGFSVSAVAKLVLSLDPLAQTLFSEVKRLLALIQCQPISAASCERSFSCLRRLKTWLRSTMAQKRLSHVALLTTHRDSLTHLDLHPLISEFCKRTAKRTAERVSIFG